MKNTTTKKLNVSRAINDAVKLCELVRKIDKAKTVRPMFKASETANKYADSMRKRYGKKLRIFNRTATGERTITRYVDIQIITGKSSDITISERSRFRRFFA